MSHVGIVVAVCSVALVIDDSNVRQAIAAAVMYVVLVGASSFGMMSVVSRLVGVVLGVGRDGLKELEKSGGRFRTFDVSHVQRAATTAGTSVRLNELSHAATTYGGTTTTKHDGVRKDMLTPSTSFATTFTSTSNSACTRATSTTIPIATCTTTVTTSIATNSTTIS